MWHSVPYFISRNWGEVAGNRSGNVGLHILTVKPKTNTMEHLSLDEIEPLQADDYKLILKSDNAWCTN